MHNDIEKEVTSMTCSVVTFTDGGTANVTEVKPLVKQRTPTPTTIADDIYFLSKVTFKIWWKTSGVCMPCYSIHLQVLYLDANGSINSLLAPFVPPSYVNMASMQIILYLLPFKNLQFDPDQMDICRYIYRN